jgi:hypothetical protein
MLSVLRILFIQQYQHLKRLRWSRGSVLAFRTPKFAGSNPAESVGIFQGEKKNPSARPSFGREVKLWVPCRRFTACERTPECYVEVGHLQAKFTGTFLAHIVPPVAARIFRRRLVAKVGNHLNYWVTTRAFSA